MSCYYCEKKEDKTSNVFIPFNKETVKYSSIEIAINCQGILRSRYFNSEGYMVTQDIVNINHCPMCGTKIRN